MSYSYDMEDLSLKKAVDALKAHYGTHTAVANALGITRDHYSKVRRGCVSTPSYLAKHILALAMIVGAGGAHHKKRPISAC